MVTKGKLRKDTDSIIYKSTSEHLLFCNQDSDQRFVQLQHLRVGMNAYPLI